MRLKSYSVTCIIRLKSYYVTCTTWSGSHCVTYTTWWTPHAQTPIFAQVFFLGDHTHKAQVNSSLPLYQHARTDMIYSSEWQEKNPRENPLFRWLFLDFFIEIQSANYYPQRIVIKHSRNKRFLYTICSKIDNILNTIDNIIINK